MNALDEAVARATQDAFLAEARQRHLARRARPPRRPHPRAGSALLTSWLSGMSRIFRPRSTRDRTQASVAEPTSSDPVVRVTALRTGPPRSSHPDDLARQLDAVLGEVAARIAEHGTRSEAPILEAMAEAVDEASPGPAAALVDWNGAEVARLRAFGVVHGVVLSALDPYAQAFLVGLILGVDLRLAG